MSDPVYVEFRHRCLPTGKCMQSDPDRRFRDWYVQWQCLERSLTFSGCAGLKTTLLFFAKYAYIFQFLRNFYTVPDFQEKITTLTKHLLIMSPPHHAVMKQSTKALAYKATCSTKTRIRALCMGSAPRQVEKCVRSSTEPSRTICHTPMAQYQHCHGYEA